MKLTADVGHAVGFGDGINVPVRVPEVRHEIACYRAMASGGGSDHGYEKQQTSFHRYPMNLSGERAQNDHFLANHQGILAPTFHAHF